MKLLKRLLQARVTLLMLLILPALGSGCATLDARHREIEYEQMARANELAAESKDCPRWLEWLKILEGLGGFDMREVRLTR